jgi:lipoprotein NlpI
MKKISLAFAFVLLINMVSKGQTDQTAGQTNLINYSSLENKLKKSNADIQDPKKNIKAKTWETRGSLMVEIYNINNQYLRKGMPESQVKLFFKEPKEVKSYQEGADIIDDYVYERITITLKNKVVESWTETNKIFDNPLPEARMSYEKALSLDTEGKESKNIKEGIAVLKLAFENEAVFDYNKNDYAGAYGMFNQILELNKLPVMESVQDTIIMYNAARAALEMKDYSAAVNLFSQVKNLGLDEPFLFVFLKNSYLAAGDTLAGENILDEGFKKYPENESILIELINFYLTAQKSEKALDFLNLAHQNDPTNTSYIFAEGTIYDKMGNFEKAKETYEKCLEIDPNFYNAMFNLGVLYYNKAVKRYEEIVNIADNQEYEKAKVEADEVFKSAIPYMEKAHEIDPNSKEPLETLKTLYLRLQMNDKYEEVNNLLKLM